MSDLAALRTFVAEVVRVVDVHPTLRQITVRGDDLGTYEPAGPDTFLYLLLPPPGRAELTVDAGFTWTAHQAMPEADRPVGAYYSQRAWRPAARELDLQCVLHHRSGPAGDWVARARVGDPVALWGPRTAWAPPADTAWHLLVADDTGLPAAAAVLEHLPHEAVVRVVAEVDGPTTRPRLPVRPGADVEVVWCHRAGRPPGTTTLLVDAVADLAWPAGTPYAWGGAESRAMAAVRRHLRVGRGLARERVSLLAYWRHADHPQEPEEP